MCSYCKTYDIILALFDFLKASNVRLALFDRIVYWIKVHRETLKYYGAERFVKCTKFVNDLNTQIIKCAMVML